MKNFRDDQGGNVLFYVLVAVALFAALSYVAMQGGGDSTAGLSATRISEDLRAQAQSIRAAIVECNLVYNNGYPADPDAPTNIENIQCQKDNVPTFVNIFSGATGRFVPQVPAPFTGNWVYRVNTGATPTNIYIELSQAVNCAANTGLSSAFDQLATMFTASELTGTVCSGAVATFRLNITI